MDFEFLKIQLETEDEFKMIADKLLNECAIENHESTFRMTEIEFYWTSPKHPDISTYPRTHVNPNHGDWFFHYSGVDIALKNEAIAGYGGILIRGIIDLNNKTKIYKGPMVCAMKLFSGTNAFTESIKTKIIEHRFDKKEVKQSPRIGLGDNAKKNGTHNLKYRFYINPND